MIKLKSFLNSIGSQEVVVLLVLIALCGNFFDWEFLLLLGFCIAGESSYMLNFLHEKDTLHGKTYNQYY